MSNKDLEPELVIYGKLADYSELVKARSRVHQSQYQKRVGQARTRVRKELDAKGVLTYTYTVKTGSEGNTEEYNEPTTETMFNAYKAWAPAGGMIKDRFSFPFTVEGYELEGVLIELCWEVDVFHNPQGGFHEWVKVDLEFPCDKEGNVYFPSELPELPLTFLKVISGSTTDETEKKVITELYERFFLTKA